MPYSDSEIRDYAHQLEAKGAPVEDIEAFVAHAVAERGGQPAAAVADAPQAASPQQRPDFIPQPHTQPDSRPEWDRPKVGLGGLVDAGLEGGGAAAGQALGAMTGPAAPVAIPAFGALGGMAGNAIAQARGDEKFSTGRLLAAGVAGAIPGGSLAKASMGTLAKEGAKYAAANLAAKTLETEVDEGRLPTAGEAALAAGSAVGGVALGKGLDHGVQWAAARQTKALQNAIRDQTLAEARAAGYVIPPSKVNPSFVNNLLESLAGKAATAQEAAVRNQEITNALARKAIGLPVDAPITLSALKQVRADAAAPYEEISQMAQQGQADLATLKKNKFTVSDPHEKEILMNDPDTVKEMSTLAIKAGADVEALKRARYAASSQYKFYQKSADPEALAKARASEEMADGLEDKIHAAAIEIGRPDLADELKASRTRIAKAYQVEQALNLGDSNVSAPILGRSFDKGAPLTGPLNTVAKFQQAFPAFAREGATVPSPGVGKLKMLASAGLGGGGFAAMGPQGVLLGAVPFVDGAARSLVLSPSYQKIMGAPFNGVDHPDFIAQAAKLSTQTLGRNGVKKEDDQ